MNNAKEYLDDETIKLLKSTTPFLKEHGVQITRLFYKKLFDSHPELKNVFNLANQSNDQQQQALANAVYGFASNLDNLDNLAEQLSRIAHKHTSLNVHPEHYPIVGKNLLAAIHEIVKQSLDEDSANTICDAWQKGYNLFASLLIDFESQLYEKAESQFSGWKGLREFALLKRERESNDTVSFYIKPTDNKSLPRYCPGQYVSVYVKGAGWDYQQIRQYSLSDAHRDDCFRLTVKKEGLVSSYLHDHWQVGDCVELTPPTGDFHLQDTTHNPVILLGAGVGVTPMISILTSVLEKRSNQPIVFAHAVKNSEQHAFKQFIHHASEQHKHRLEKIIFYEKPLITDQLSQDYDHQGFMDLDLIASSIRKNNADYYLCGPKPFMASLHKTLSSWGVQKENIHYEVFGSGKSLY